ncbi:hypothetical protein [Desulfospira joergensenii]|uniref:hypothetical protein n=1 Tax=Desulfospira joergensenii TaxID=53329 RepID=UPI0003B6FB8F|nr:hypothetical protein [Desulfospira joergensenii]
MITDKYLYYKCTNNNLPGKIIVPFLVQVETKNWEPLKKIPDLKIFSKMGKILACTGSLDSIRSLEQDPRVIKIEASK